MPRHLSELTADEQGLYSALSRQPQATDLPSLLADNAEDRGEQARADLLHQNARVALSELLRRRALTNDECAQVLQQPSEDTTRQVSRLLGRPDPNAPLPNLLTEEGFNEQFTFAQTLLAAYGLPTGSVRAEDVWHRIQENKGLCEQIEKERRSLLLLVPRLPLPQVTAALTAGLHDNEDILGLRPEQSLSETPVNVTFPSTPHYLAPRHSVPEPDRWLTEEQWLAEKDVDVLFVEPSPHVHLPAESGNRSVVDIWRDRKPGEVLPTPQTWGMFVLTLLVLRGHIPDRDTFSLLAGARFAPSNHASSGRVPYGFWLAARNRAYLAWEDVPLDCCVRFSVRVASEGN